MRKTLLIATFFPPEIGGIQNYLSNIAKRLDPDKLAVLAPMNPKMGKEIKEFDSRQPYKIIRVNFYYPWKIIWPRWMPLLKTARKLIEKEKFGQILCGEVSPAGIVSYIIKMKNPIEYSVFTYALDIILPQKSRTKTKYTGEVLREAKNVFTISEFTKNELKKFNVQEGKIKFVYPGIDLKEFLGNPEFLKEKTDTLRSKLKLDGKKIILTLSRLVKRKGQDKMICAMKHIIKKFPESIYLIAGEGPYEKNLRELVLKFNLQEHVKFIHGVSDKEKPAYYNLCDVFAMPSRVMEKEDAEGFGIVFLEAAALGKPTLGSKEGGIPDAVIDRKTGLLVNNPNDPQEIADKIIKLLEDPAYASNLGEVGKRRAEKDFNWDKIVSNLKEFI